MTFFEEICELITLAKLNYLYAFKVGTEFPLAKHYELNIRNGISMQKQMLEYLRNLRGGHYSWLH